MQNNINNNREHNYQGQEPNKQYRSDADRIVHRHLRNKNDIITDEDLRNIKVGVSEPEMDQATMARFDESEEVDEMEDRIADEGNEEQGANGKASGSNPITPWDLEK